MFSAAYPGEQTQLRVYDAGTPSRPYGVIAEVCLFHGPGGRSHQHSQRDAPIPNGSP
jgi:hypothetical protein